MLGTIKLINNKLVIEYKLNTLISDYKVSDYKSNVANICTSQKQTILEKKLVGTQVEFILLSQTKIALVLF